MPFSTIPLGTGPTLVYAEVDPQDGTKVYVLFSQKILPMMLSGVASGLTLAGKTISAYASAGALVTLTVSVAYAYGDVPLLGFTPQAVDPLQSESAETIAAFSNYAVLNKVGNVTPLVPTFPVKLASLVDLGSNVYQASANFAYGLANMKIPAGGSGWVQHDILSAANWTSLLGLRSVYANDAQVQVDYHCLTSSSSAGALLRSLQAAANTNIGYTMVVGTDTVLRLRRDAVAKTISVDTFTSGVWQTRYTFVSTAYYDGDLFIRSGINTSGKQLAGLKVVGGVPV